MGELGMALDLLAGTVLHPRLRGPLVLLAHADADARQVVDEEIHPVIRGDLDEHVGLRGLDAAAELGHRARQAFLVLRAHVLPAADDERRVAGGEYADEPSHGWTSPPTRRPRCAPLRGTRSRACRRRRNRSAADRD